MAAVVPVVLGNCRHFHDGFYYETPWWTLPLIIGGIAANAHDGYDRLSCGEARSRVRNSGFRNVYTIECNGRTYTFEATRRGRDVTVFVDSRNGADLAQLISENKRGLLQDQCFAKGLIL